MSQIFEKLSGFDDWLFDAKYGFQNISENIQKTIGISCIQQGILFELMYIGLGMTVNRKFNIFIEVGISLGTFLAFLMLAFFSENIAGKKFINILRFSQGYKILRLFFIISDLSLIIFHLIYKGKFVPSDITIFGTIALYLISCDKLPPGDSWLKKLFTFENKNLAQAKS